MDPREKKTYYREEDFQKARGRRNHRAGNSHNTPSFSSTLLDSIYRSIDDVKAEDWMISRAKTRKGSDMAEDFRSASLVDKWMRKEKSDETKRRPAPVSFPEHDKDGDLLFFSSTSTSSDSSGALSSSSETEFFARSKPIRTDRKKKDENHQKEDDDMMIKSKSRALKIYARLKKVKQPISPGGRLTTFINSLFSLNGKKQPKSYADPRKVALEDPKSPKAGSSTCSTASSFSRSCLSKHSREKIRGVGGGGGVQRTVRFHPVSVIVDEDSRPCGHKYIHGRPPLPPKGKNINDDDASVNALRSYYRAFDEDDDDDSDMMSESSSDLFELDHLALFGDTRFCQELPVYETTHFDNNRSFVC